MGFTTHEITTDITRQLSRYIVETTYEDIPPAVIERAKMLILHTIGVSLGALPLRQAQDVLAIAREMSSGEGGEATLWGDGRKVSLEAAALAAGTLADLLDWEDCSWTGHPSAGVVPAAVIAAQTLKKSGRELLTAVVVGYEIYQRIAMAARGNIVSPNIFGATVPIAKLAGLTEGQINQALGMAAACAAIPVNVHEATMSDALNYLYGFKVENAVTIVRTALLGIENLEDTFDDPTAYTAHLRAPQPEWFLKDLGVEYLLMNILVKHWPANMYVQTYIELADTIRRRYGVDPDQIERVLLHPSVSFRHYTTADGYESLTQAQFSIPYGIAAMLYHPDAGSVWYQPETMKDPRIVSLMNKVTADSFCSINGLKNLIQGHHPEKFMTVRMKDGQEYTEGLFTHPGHPSYMFTREQFHETFRQETAKVLSSQEADHIIYLVGGLENLPDASALSECLYHHGGLLQ